MNIIVVLITVDFIIRMKRSSVKSYVEKKHDLVTVSIFKIEKRVD